MRRNWTGTVTPHRDARHPNVTHDELVTRGGLHAELFSLQAAGYR